MNDDDFEWDDAKALANEAKHGVSFQAARFAFADPFAVEQIDNRNHYGEVRYVIFGMVDNRLLTVVYTERNGIIRIISARAAEPYERREYHERNARTF